MKLWKFEIGIFLGAIGVYLYGSLEPVMVLLTLLIFFDALYMTFVKAVKE